MSTAVTATIKNGAEVMPSTYGLVSIDIVKEVNRIPYAQVTLLDGDAAKQKFAISDGSFFEPGKEIEILLRYEGGQNISVFKGLVIKQFVEANRQGTLLTIELKDAAIRLAQSRKSAVYRDKPDTKIIEDLIKNGELKKKGAWKATDLSHPELVQYYCTDWDFMLSRAEACGLLVVADAGEIALKEITLNDESAEGPIFEFGISPIYDFEMEVDASHQRASIETLAWDVKNQALTQTSKAKEFTLKQGNLNAENIAKLIGGSTERLASVVSLPDKGLQAWADAVMKRSRMAMLRGRMGIPGLGDAHLMDVINVKGVGERFNGKTLVTGIRHRVTPMGWRTDLQFGLSPERSATRRDVMDTPAAGLLPAVNGLQIGVVADFEEDPDKDLRVKIILPGIDEKNSALWARLASPDAGKERGYFFRPEPGDEVVVGFFNDDPRQAVILGAMYGSKNTPHKDVANLTKDNIEKGIVSKKGSMLAFTDEEKPSVLIKTPNSNTIIFDDDAQMIEISDQHGNSIKMDKNGIEIKSAKDLKIRADGNVEIAGSKVDVK